MKRLLLDVNIVLDVLLERPPHFEHAAALGPSRDRQGRSLLSAHAVTIVHYLVAMSTIAGEHAGCHRLLSV